MNQEAFFAVSDYVTNSLSPVSLVKNMQKAADYMAGKGIGIIHTVSGVGFARDLDVDLERWEKTTRPFLRSTKKVLLT